MGEIRDPLVDDTESPRPPHQEPGGGDDPDTVSTDTNYKYSDGAGGYQTYVTVRITSVLDSYAQVPAAAWNDKIVLNNLNSDNGASWQMRPFFFNNNGGGGAGDPIKGYCCGPNSTDTSPYAVVRVDGSGDEVSFASTGTPTSGTNTYNISIVSVTTNGSGKDVKVHVDTVPPAGSYVCVFCKVVSPTRKSWSDYSAQGNADLKNFDSNKEQTINVPYAYSSNTGWFAFIVSSNPATGHPSVISNTAFHT